MTRKSKFERMQQLMHLRRLQLTLAKAQYAKREREAYARLKLSDPALVRYIERGLKNPAKPRMVKARQHAALKAVSLGPFEHGYIDAGDLGKTSEMGPAHRATLLYPKSLSHRTQYVDGWHAGMAGERANPLPKKRRRLSARRKARITKQVRKHRRWVKAPRIFIRARRGRGPVLYWNGRSFADFGPAHPFTSIAAALRKAKFLRAANPKLKAFRMTLEDSARSTRVNPERRADVNEAARKFEDFTGRAPGAVTKASLSDDKTSWELGPIKSIEYEATRDGETARWHHPFKKRSRPLLTASRDGSQLHIVGGRYEVTDAGIEDR